MISVHLEERNDDRKNGFHRHNEWARPIKMGRAIVDGTRAKRPQLPC
jgi:hypothetical protein